MPRPRKHLVSVSETPYYHVSSRCVRRAFLCGVDRYSGQSFEHRRQWVEDRSRILASLFAIELCAYAIMSNHYHLVVRLIPNETEKWSDDEVLRRWTALYRGPILVQRYRSGEQLSVAELATLQSMTAVFRRRLASLSWFMKCLNEPIARMANKEDDCTGHFWEGRFYSQALRSERALLAAMVYVDLNPVRAGLAQTYERSTHTSLRARTNSRECSAELAAGVASAVDRRELFHFEQSVRPLAPFIDNVLGPAETALQVTESAYLGLVAMTSRVSTADQRKRVDPVLQSILDRLQLSMDQWIEASSAFKQYYRAGDLAKTA